MDLLQSVRKEGSRGGVNFSWDDVKGATNRESYLGHSLMAPVGRWQKNKDLNWYAKAEDAELTPEERAERERERKREELRKIKEAEEDAMARAMGLPVPDRTNANNEPLGISQKEVNKALKEALDDGEEEVEAPEKGIGFGARSGRVEDGREVMKGSSQPREDRKRHRSRSRQRRRHHDDERSEKRRHRSHSRSKERHRERRHRHRSRSRSNDRDRDRRNRSRSRDRHEENHRSHRRDRERDDRPRSRDRDRKRHRSRSRSPYQDRRRRDDR